MEECFAPHVTARRAKFLMYGKMGTPGLASTWTGLNITNDYMAQMEMAAQAVKLCGGKITLPTMHTTLAPLFLREMVKEEVEFLCWRIIANIGFLMIDHPVLPFQGLIEITVSPLEIVGAKPGWSRGKEPKYGTTLEFKVIDGELCPLRFERWFPQNFLWTFAKELEISKYRAKARFTGERNQLYGMRFVAALEPSKFESGAITFDRWWSGQFISRNQRLMRLRHQPCPKEYEWACHECTLGEDSCPVKGRACRPRTLEKQFCSRCTDVTWHDAGKCASCRSRRPVARSPR